MTVTKPLFIQQGATFSFGFTWSDGEEVDGSTVAGDPKDLTGWQARMQIRARQGAPAQVTANTTNHKIILGLPFGHAHDHTDAAIDPTNGRIHVELSDEDTDTLTTLKSKYDLEVEDPDGRVYRLLEGTVTVSPNITQEDGTEEVIDV